MNEVGAKPGHVFISYVREDSQRVDRLQQMLRAAGIPVWRDKDSLWPGEDWKIIVRQAISDNALVFIACFSSVSVSRSQSYQYEELVLALEQMRQRHPQYPWLIPVRFDECEIPDYDIGGGRILSSIQRVDLFDEESQKSAARLVASVNRILEGNGRAIATATHRPGSRGELPNSSVGSVSDPVAQRVLALVNTWEEKTGLACWHDLTYKLTKPVPSLSRKQYDRLVELGRWLLGRNWPYQRFPKTSAAFGNMLFVVQDLVAQLNDSGEVTDDYWQIRREYKEVEWDFDRHEILVAKYRETEWTIYALAIELTKAANWVTEMVRAELEPLYRFDEGSLLLFMADLVNGEMYIRAEYNHEETESASRYAGLDRIREAVKGMNGNLSWQVLFELS